MKIYLSLFFTMLLSFNFIHAQNKIVAHRGAWKNTGAPQNSLESFQHAVKLGFAGSEFDINMSQDGKLVINHDDTYFDKEIEKYTYDELNHTKLKNGEDLPLLSSFFKFAKKHPKTILFAEIKPSPAGAKKSEEIAEATYKMAKKYKLLSRIVFISFSHEALLKIRSIDKKVPLQFLNGNLSPEQLKKERISGLDYNFKVYEREETWLDNAKKLGLSTNVWTVNKPESIEYFLIRNVDFITTDEPELALALSEKKYRKLLWSEEFNYTGLPDQKKWSYDTGGNGWGNQEAQYYTEADTNTAIVKNGHLTITAHKQTIGQNQYTSARLITKGKQEFKYGRIEVRAKLPAGRGTWPAIWMLGSNINEIGWPKCGEIDIMEHVGYDPGVIVGTLHSDKYNHIKGTQITGKVNLIDFSSQFHVYAIEWSKEKIDFFVDDNHYLSIPNKFSTIEEWPFDNPHFLILNLAIGGSWGGQKGIDESIFPVNYQIDYVRWFE